jgi:hypothetical protein
MILKQQMGEEEGSRRSREMIVQVAVILVIRFCRYSAGAPPERSLLLIQSFIAEETYWIRDHHITLS